MINYTLSIAGNWQNTFRRWASELRAKTPLEDSDFKLPNSFETSITANGAMTVSAITRKRLDYDLKGNICFCSINSNFTLGGVANTRIYFTLPFTATTRRNQAFFLVIEGAGHVATGYITANTNFAEVLREASVAFSLGSSGLTGNFFYEIN